MLGVAVHGEQNWYPPSRIGYFTDLAQPGINGTRDQIDLFAPPLAEPYRLDDATVNHAIRVYENQRADQVLYRNQADRWAGEVMSADQKAALGTYVARLDELDQLIKEVLGICATLSQQTIEKLMPASDKEAGLEALLRLARDGRI